MRLKNDAPLNFAAERSGKFTVIKVPPERLVPTDKIDPSICQELEFNISEGQAIDPIVVAPVGVQHFIILDGNHRAYKLAEHQKDIEAIVIKRESDRDLILSLETEMVIHHFPHRDFLAGSKNLSQLITSAKQSARRTGFSNILEMVTNRPGRSLSGGPLTDETPAEKLARLEAENQVLRAQMEQKKDANLRLKVSEKGGLSVYGLGRFPVTLYKEQWVRLLGYTNEIKSFLKENDALLKAKQ
jgi:hypothetical protein